MQVYPIEGAANHVSPGVVSRELAVDRLDVHST